MRLLLFLFVVLFFGCHSTRKKTEHQKSNIVVITDSFAVPKMYIYKTRANYNNLVPITLSHDKRTIAGFPHPLDLFIDGKLAKPITLPEGYLFDIIGISANVAFLKITYEEYSKLTGPPTIETLKKQIKDNDPLLELWDCGYKTNEPDEVQKISSWIESEKLADFAKRIK